MNNTQLLIAACGTLVLLALTVGVRMFYVRIGEMRERRLHPQAAANALQVAQRLQNVQTSDNFKNLFEVPVLFYTLVAVALAVDQVPGWLVAGAWLFVLLRYVHSAIHCSYNQVMHRFAVFGLSLAVLSALWAGFLVGVLLR